MLIEEWKDIPGYKNLYQVSNLGNIKSLISNIILKPDISRGRFSVRLTKQNKEKRKLFFIHQLVAMAFLNHKPNGYKEVVDHKDDNPHNNRLNNLQIISQRNNIAKIKRTTKSGLLGVETLISRTGKITYRASFNFGKQRIKFTTTDSKEESKVLYDLCLLNEHEFKGDINKFKDLIYERKALVGK